MRNLIGMRFGKLIVVGFEPQMPKRNFWECNCECGNITFVRSESLLRGNTKSCGCGMIAQARINSRAASARRAYPFPHARKLKDLFRNMHDRCYNPKNKRWDNYGGKGVIVCEEWHDRATFYAWCNANGYQPGLQIDRKRVNGDYSPANCRFVDAIVQMNNTTRNRWIRYGNKTLTVAQWARKMGMKPEVLNHRLHRKWPISKALNQPVRKCRAAD